MKPTKINRRAILSASSVAIIYTGISAPVALAANWLNTGTADWNTATNWSTGRVPIKTGFNDQAVIITNTGAIATISANISATPTDILVGNGAGISGRVDHTAGTAQSGTGNWIKVGNNGGTGVYNLANTAVVGTGISGFAQGTGSLTAGATGNFGQIRVGAGDGGTGNTGTFNMNTTGSITAAQVHVGATTNSNGRFNLESGTITSNGDIYVGNANAGGSGRLDISAGTVTSTGWMKVGHNGGSGIINLANTGTTGGTLTGFGLSSGSMNVSGNYRLGGGDAGSGGSGTMNMNTSGTLTVTGPLHVGTQASTGVLNLDSGTIAVANSFFIGNAASATGTVNISGGTLNKTNNATAFAVGNGGGGTLSQTGGAITVNGEFWVGSTSTATYTMSGGTLSSDTWFVVGRNGSGVGTLNMSGGTITKGGSNNVVIGADSATANGTVAMTGGLFNVTGGITVVGNNGGIGALTLSNTAEFRTTQLVLATGTGTGTANFNGGTLEVGTITRTAGTGNAYFNGTKIVPKADSATFISNLSTAEIQGGGLKIDSSGKSLVVPQELSGTGTLIKSGAGTLALSGVNAAFTGSVSVNGGTLAIEAAKYGGANYTVADSAALKVSSITNFDVRELNSLTLGSSGATTLSFDLGNELDNPYYAPLKVASLALNGPVTINIADSNITLGSIPLVEYTSKSGSGSVLVTPGSLPNGVTATVVDNGTGLISLQVTGLAQPKWDATVNGIWDTSTVNWLNAGSPTAYTNGRVTQFDDGVTGLTQGDVTLNIGVTPTSLTFDNTLVPYTLNGTGSINGTTGVLKRGTASLVLNTTNGYTGVTELKGGTTSISSIANAGSPSSIGAASASAANLLLTGGSLTYTGSSTTTDRGFTLGAIDTAITTTADIRFDGEVVSNPTSNLIKTGAGKLGFGGTAAKAIGTVNKGLRIYEGTVSFTGTGANSVAAELWLGNPASTINSALEVTNSNLTTGNWIAIGIGNGSTGLHSDVTFTGSTITANGGGISLGYDGGVVGYSAISSLTMNNSTFSGPTGNFGESNGATINVTLNGTSALNLQQVNVGINSGSIGTMVMKDSSTATVTNRVYVGGNAGSVGNLTVQDSASITLPGEQEFRVGSGGQGTVTQTGGTITGNGWMAIGRVAGGSGTLSISGGTFTQAAAARFMHVGELGSGTLTISGTGSFVAASTTGLLIGDAADSSGTVNLNGGTLTANAILDSASGTSAFNFNGGLLKAGSAANAVFMNGVDTVTVKSGGGVIDSDGHDITINPSLLDGGTGGGLTKQGAGILSLAGTNTYTGNTTVNGGTLTLSASGQLRFVIGANGVSNKVTGTGSVQLDGSFNIDTTAANTTAGNSWTLVDVGSLTETYGGTFSVAGFTNSSGVWTKTAGGNLWTFTQSTGVLTVQVATGGYSSWAATNAGGQTESQDYDGDGVQNGIEYFMGQTGSGFTANPSVVAGQITWPKSAGFSGTYRVETSTNLTSWTDVTGSAVDNGSSVSYTLPTGNAKLFVHLLVTPN
ncbi:beta strand repeat-containing protein [Luteolibacter soli]|uniref:Autotransporter-associated beta strand repeat-containing protein n=1 Tax=Luteolibacter soli TaxID=3135280 RepID=A0ABU9APK6_9BACT